MKTSFDFWTCGRCGTTHQQFATQMRLPGGWRWLAITYPAARGEVAVEKKIVACGTCYVAARRWLDRGKK